MNRQQQIEHFLLAAHRVAVACLRAEPDKAEEVSTLLTQKERAELLRASRTA